MGCVYRGTRPSIIVGIKLHYTGFARVHAPAGCQQILPRGIGILFRIPIVMIHLGFPSQFGPQPQYGGPGVGVKTCWAAAVDGQDGGTVVSGWFLTMHIICIVLCLVHAWCGGCVFGQAKGNPTLQSKRPSPICRCQSKSAVTATQHKQTQFIYICPSSNSPIGIIHRGVHSYSA